METRTVTREELYEQVWSRPVREVAAEYGRSDAGLAKLCRRHRMPLRGRGYWQKLRTPPCRCADTILWESDVYRDFRQELSSARDDFARTRFPVVVTQGGVLALPVLT